MEYAGSPPDPSVCAWFSHLVCWFSTDVGLLNLFCRSSLAQKTSWFCLCLSVVAWISCRGCGDGGQMVLRISLEVPDVDEVASGSNPHPEF